MKNAIIILLVVSLGLAGAVYYELTVIESRNLEITDLQSQLTTAQTELVSVPQPNSGNHFIEVHEGIAGVDCPRAFGVQWQENLRESCAIQFKTLGDGKYGFGISVIEGEYISYEQNNPWADETDPPGPSVITCSALNVANADTHFETNGYGYNFKVPKQVGLEGKNIVNLPTKEMSTSQLDVLKSATRTIRVVGLIDTVRLPVGGTCGSPFEEILLVEEI